jgi:hypothetical protein
MVSRGVGAPESITARPDPDQATRQTDRLVCILSNFSVGGEPNDWAKRLNGIATDAIVIVWSRTTLMLG